MPPRQLSRRGERLSEWTWCWKADYDLVELYVLAEIFLRSYIKLETFMRSYIKLEIYLGSHIKLELNALAELYLRSYFKLEILVLVEPYLRRLDIQYYRRKRKHPSRRSL